MELAARGAIRAQVTKISKAATEFMSSENSRVRDASSEELESIEEQLCTFLDRLTAASNSLKSADQIVLSGGFLQADTLDNELKKVSEYEDTIVSTMSKLNFRVLKVRAVLYPQTTQQYNEDNSHKPPKTAVKLPKLELKKFGGDLRDWLPFWSQFESSIHKNEDLSPFDKFNYLESSLFGVAKNTIKGFTASAACYDAAVSLLLEQYGNTEKLVDQYVQKLINIRPVAQKSDVVGLRLLYNTVTTSIRSLSALQIPAHQYNVMLKSILLRCLPAELRVEYHRNNKTTPSSDEEVLEQNEEGSEDNSSLRCIGDKYIQNIMRFLKREVEALENSKFTPVHSYTQKSQQQQSTAASLLGVNKNNIPVCVFCNSNDHSTKDCVKEMTMKQKRDILIKANRCFRCANVGHSSKKCRSVKFLKCGSCGGKHITSMCDPNFKEKKEAAANLCAYDNANNSNIFLKTAQCVAMGAKANFLVRVVVDGGSQHSYIRQSLVTKLKLPLLNEKINISILPFGSKEQLKPQALNKVRINLKSQYSDKDIQIEAIVVPEICVDVLKAPDNSCRAFKKLELADRVVVDIENFDGLSLLIGSDFYWEVVTGKQRRLSSRLRAVETIFGWALQGLHSSIENDPKQNKEHSSFVTHVLSLQISDKELSKMWSLESIGIRGEELEKSHLTEEMTSRCLKKVGSRYVASMPWKDPQAVFEDNKHIAVSRLNSLKNRLSRDPEKFKEYDLAVRQMIEDGIAEPIMTSNEHSSKRIIYLPHRPVYKESSATTKLRIVFDASSHSENIPSLNDQLFTGTNLLPDVFSILLNFRLGSIAIVADIEKAFLQIFLNEVDRDAHRFLWYSSSKKNSEIAIFRMTRVTFGVSCSPFILSATINHHLSLEQSTYPETCQTLQNGFYVDDLVVSVNSEQEAVKLYKQAVDIMGRASMNLRKWHSNNEAVRDAAGSLEYPTIQKVLGLLWSPFSDELAVPLDSLHSFLASNQSKGSKRNVLQAIARVYDPLGIVSPVIIKLKIVFQEAWKRKLSWDEDLPSDLMLQWNECIRNVLQLKDMTIPRAIQSISSARTIYCHIFADASIKAYGAVAFLQIINERERITSFLCAKSRVAPLKEDNQDELTLPKLELTAALIAARLCAYFKKSLNISIDKFFLWTDSKITLNWIFGETQRWKPYVQSRVLEIRRFSSVSDWNHCSGKCNPADLLTRGTSGNKLISSLLWEKGPDWLDNPENFSNRQETENFQFNTTLLVEVDDSHPRKVEFPINCESFNSWIRLLRVTSWIIRYIRNLKEKAERRKTAGVDFVERELNEKIPIECLKKEELDYAENIWIKNVQINHYSSEIENLRKQKQLKPSSKLIELSPFLDEDGIMRVGGRLQMLEEEFDLKHPIILPADHHATSLIIDNRHLLTCHGGTSAVLTKLRQRFWIVRGRQLVAKRLRRCIVCKKLFGQPANQPFAPLPIQRITLTRPFDCVGIDFAGPLYYVNPGDGSQHKAYILIFTCAAIRAVHLELTTDMSTDSCLMAIRRFIARRGVPSTIVSDNAKTFRRSALDLSKIHYEVLDDNVLHDFLTQKQIKWKFSVERAPWWGGFWERLIRTVKNTLKVVIGKAKLTFDQLRTILSETEAQTNDRPLTYTSNDPLELVPLTPAKFLIGWTAQSHDHQNHTVTDETIKELWKHRMKYTSKISKRWRAEYLQLLRSFHHGSYKSTIPLKEGDVMLLHDQAKSRIHWKMVVIEQVYPGRDGRIRACEVRCPDGNRFRRPVQLLYPLELSLLPPGRGC